MDIHHIENGFILVFCAKEEIELHMMVERGEDLVEGYLPGLKRSFCFFAASTLLGGFLQ